MKYIELTRSMKQYTDVERFEDYELRPCLAYEMAIRNSEVIKLIKEEYYNGGESRHPDILLEKYNFGSEYHLDYHFFQDISSNKGSYECNTKEMQHIISNDRRILIGDYDGFMVRTEIHGDQLDPEESSVLPRFKRPHMETYPIFKTVDVHLNFGLPKNELLAYVSHIWDKYQNEPGIFPSGYEVNHLHSIEHSTHKPTNGMTASKWADAFFAYDYWKLHIGKKPKEDIKIDIEIELEEYNPVKERTIQRYIDSMIEYIDYLKYKELLTGVNIQNM